MVHFIIGILMVVRLILDFDRCVTS